MSRDYSSTIDASDLPQRGEERRAFLVVYHGERSRMVELRDGEEITIGRSRDAVIDLDDTRVSRLHAAVVRRGQSLYARDLGSHNGTRVNGEALAGERRVTAGDEIGVGGASLVVGLTSPPAVTPAVGPVSGGRGEAARPDVTPPEPRAGAVGKPGGRTAVVVVDAAMKRVFELARRVAPTPMTVLLLGETGVGKELVAEEIHRQSPRARQPLVRLNCASLPETLLESELFGSERGAFTGADRRRRGYFEAASGGTLLLDEIGELPSSTQAKLLRALESRTVTRLGATDEVPVDVRVVTATNRDLQEEVRRGRFREDLFFRVSAFSLFVPPLRDRPDDIDPLCDLFAREFAATMGVPAPGFSGAARARLHEYRWPGNVRELRHVVERALVLGASSIEVTHLPPQLQGPAARLPDSGGVPAEPLEDGAAITDRLAAFERQSIEEALAQCGGNQTRAAQRLGITRRALIYKMEKLGLKPPPPSAR
jgi:two-component system, NtrC family, response regulator AtoC